MMRIVLPVVLSTSQCPREYGCWNVETQRLGSPEVEGRFVAARSLPSSCFTLMRAYPCVVMVLLSAACAAPGIKCSPISPPNHLPNVPVTDTALIAHTHAMVQGW